MKVKIRKQIVVIILFGAVAIISCKKYVDVKPPVTSVTGATVYNSDGTAIAVVTGLYAGMSKGSIFAGIDCISIYAGLSADEFTLSAVVSPTDRKYYYYTNELFANSSGAGAGFEFWNSFYNYIFICNSAIEGLSQATALTPAVKQQLLGEVKFLRAFYYFYLTNLFGDVPLVLTTDYKVNAVLEKAPKQKIYEQIIQDLKDAQGLLVDGYVDGSLLKSTSERVRPNKWAATALLARAYLFFGDWINAEAQATQVINHSSFYSLVDLNHVFLKNSKEAIWQLQPVNIGWNTEDARVLILPSTGPNDIHPVYLSLNLLENFEKGDNRRTSWVDSVKLSPENIYYYPYKYKSAILDEPVTEYMMALRVGEQYLIRSEARAKQDNIEGAKMDLHEIRKRAGLTDAVADDRYSLLAYIIRERRTELFTEWGHRWLDLKRTGTVDSVMSAITPLKSNGRAWESYQQLYPLPTVEIQRNKNLVQNNGY